MSKAGVTRMAISQLTPNSTDFFIVAVIIAKRSPKKFTDKRDGNLRGVFGFTVRDSPADYINITVWGSALHVEDLASRFRVGDVVDVINPKVAVRREGLVTQFEPPVTSFLDLVFNENSSEIVLHDEQDTDDFHQLLRLPTKPPTYFITIADLKASGKPLSGQWVNLLVAVQKVVRWYGHLSLWYGQVIFGYIHFMKAEPSDNAVGHFSLPEIQIVNPPRAVMTKNGESQVQDVQVMDATSLGFIVTTWETPIIHMMMNWQPRETCLFLADVRLTWSEFKEQMTGVLNSKSIVTENPDTNEAKVLAKYASTVPIQRTAVVDSLAASLINPESITNIMSCDAILEQAMSSSNNDSFTALVYAVVENYNLDGCVPAVRIKCAICGGLIKENCSREECLVQPTYGLILPSYDIRVTFIDHSNALENCRLKGENAVKLLGLKNNTVDGEKWEEYLTQK